VAKLVFPPVIDQVAPPINKTAGSAGLPIASTHKAAPSPTSTIVLSVPFDSTPTSSSPVQHTKTVRIRS
jgi:hypothetical protein